MPNLSDRGLQKGQALLIILLVLSVVLTLALSAVSRSVTDISISTTEEESLRAFSAAEAGIEEALISSSTAPYDNTLNERASYKVNFPNAEPTGDSMIHPREFLSGETATMWFVSQNDDGIFACGTDGTPCVQATDIEFCWGYEGASEEPAIEISLYYDETQDSIGTQNYSGIKIVRKVFDPDGSRVSVNKFLEATGSCGIAGGDSLAHTTNSLSLSGDSTNDNEFGIPAGCLNKNGCLLFARTRFFYNDSSPQPIRLSVALINPPDTSRLPAQGVIIESTGRSGESVRKVNVFQSFAEPPEIFDSAVFSLNNLVKSN